MVVLKYMFLGLLCLAMLLSVVVMFLSDRMKAVGSKMPAACFCMLMFSCCVSLVALYAIG